MGSQSIDESNHNGPAQSKQEDHYYTSIFKVPFMEKQRM